LSDANTALLIVDMISDWQFEDADKLVGPALEIAPAIARLKARCREAGIPVLYVNDHHGDWRTDFDGVIERSIALGGQGSKITTQLRPDADDYFVLKPMHSAFYATPLEVLLRHLHVRRVIVVGVSTDQCIVLTAGGARLRDLAVWVPSDAVASQTPRRNALAVELIEHSLLIDTRESTAGDLSASAGARSPGN